MIKQTLLAAIMALSVTSAHAITLGDTEYVVTDRDNSSYYMKPQLIIDENLVQAGYWQDASKDKTAAYRSKTVISEYNCTNRTEHTLFIRTTYPNGRMRTVNVSDVRGFEPVIPNTIGEALLEAACSVLETY